MVRELEPGSLQTQGQQNAVSAGRHGSYSYFFIADVIIRLGSHSISFSYILLGSVIASIIANADVNTRLGSYSFIASFFVSYFASYFTIAKVFFRDSFAIAEVGSLCSAIAEGIVLGRVAIVKTFVIITIVKFLLLFLAQQSSQAGRCQVQQGIK